jgi:hypothetical protein
VFVADRKVADLHDVVETSARDGDRFFVGLR